MKKLLDNAAKSINIILSDEQLDKFQKYYDILIETNKYMNLTAITEVEDVVQKHFIDSIALINYIDISDKSIIDVGTGAGFPGIPLAIVKEDAQFTLMDSLNKRIKFLNDVIEVCNLNNVNTVHSRAEDLGRNEDYREQFDICVSRAVANMSVLLEYCIPFVKSKGEFISYKSDSVDEEVKQSQNAQKKLGCKLNAVEKFVLPGTDIQRKFIIFDKVRNTPKTYPRQAGKPKRTPL